MPASPERRDQLGEPETRQDADQGEDGVDEQQLADFHADVEEQERRRDRQRRQPHLAGGMPAILQFKAEVAPSAFKAGPRPASNGWAVNILHEI